MRRREKAKMRRREKAKMRLLDLPVEILCDIFKRLSLKSVCCLRCVSKTLLDIVQSPFFFSLHSRFSILSNAASDHQPPRLTLRFVGEDSSTNEMKEIECLNYDGSNGSLTVSKILSTSDDARYSLYFAYCNFFLFTRNYEDCFLIDPFTREVLRLPKSGIQYSKYGTHNTKIFNEVYGMGFDSLTRTHKILRLSEITQIRRENAFDWSSVAQILELGTNSWREIPPQTLNSSSAPKYPLCSHTSICAYGEMHWLSLEGREILIISFDFTKEEFYRTPTLELPSLKLVGTNLIALKGSMAVVIIDFPSCLNIDIWVMKDYHTKQWVRDYTIDLHESCHDFGFMNACCGEWENGILFDDELDETSLFVDLRCNSMKVMKRPSRCKGIWSNILSVHRSLLSLKNYGNLDEARPPLLDFRNNYLWQHSD